MAFGEQVLVPILDRVAPFSLNNSGIQNIYPVLSSVGVFPPNMYKSVDEGVDTSLSNPFADYLFTENADIINPNYWNPNDPNAIYTAFFGPLEVVPESGYFIKGRVHLFTIEPKVRIDTNSIFDADLKRITDVGGSQLISGPFDSGIEFLYKVERDLETEDINTTNIIARFRLIPEITGINPIWKNEVGIGAIELIASGSASQNLIPLYIKGPIVSSDNIPLYMMSPETNNMDLFIEGQSSSSGAMDLYLLNTSGLNNNMPLYLFNTNPSGEMPLYISGGKFKQVSNNVPLYLWATTNSGIRNNIKLFLKAEPTSGTFDNNQPLFIEGQFTGNSNSNIPLYIARKFDKDSSNVPLFLQTPISTNSGVPLFLNAPSGNGGIPLNNNMPLFLQRRMFDNKNTPLYISGPQTINNTMDLFMPSQVEKSGVDLFIQGKDTNTNNVKLYTDGF